jgi:hypothetical protein
MYAMFPVDKALLTPFSIVVVTQCCGIDCMELYFRGGGDGGGGVFRRRGKSAAVL